jgi:hypothetical protein
MESSPSLPSLRQGHATSLLKINAINSLCGCLCDIVAKGGKWWKDVVTNWLSDEEMVVAINVVEICFLCIRRHILHTLRIAVDFYIFLPTSPSLPHRDKVDSFVPLGRDMWLAGQSEFTGVGPKTSTSYSTEYRIQNTKYRIQNTE